MKKIKAWSKRYLPAEALSLLTSVIAGLVVQTVMPYPVIIAYAAALGENVGYYSYQLGRELRENRRQYHGVTGLAGAIRVIVRTLRNLLLEFGPAEALDSLVVRPFFLYLYAIHIPHLALALVLGKITADVVFYLIAISSYELKRKYFN